MAMDLMSQPFATGLYAASTWVIPLVIAITFHEASHGYVARLCGDDTAWRLGLPSSFFGIRRHRPIRLF
jgi:hypothetical protein